MNSLAEWYLQQGKHVSGAKRGDGQPSALKNEVLDAVKYFPVNIMYQTTTVFVAIFILGFLWFALVHCILPMSTAIDATMQQYSNMTSYPSWNLSNTFMTNLWLFLLVIVIFGLLYWSWLYSQRKGQVMY